MTQIDPQNESTLRSELDASRKRIEASANELRALDAELEALGVEREQNAVLEDVCSGLEKLAACGAADRFWRGFADEAVAHAHVASVRERVDAFRSQIEQLENSRARVLERMRAEQANGEFLADDLYELKRAEEERKHEWIVEREPSSLPYRAAVMAWTRGLEEDRRLRRALGRTLLAAVLLGVLLPWIPLPEPERWELIEVPDRFARLIEERVAPPPAPERPPKPREPVREEPLLAEKGTPQPTASEAPPIPDARSKGILAFSEQFSSLAESAAAANLGSKARIERSGELASGRSTRSLVATEGPGSSGGIDLASLSRNVGGGGNGIEGVEVARASSAIGAVGGGGDRPLSGGPGSARSDEEIQIVFDRHKAALYRLYNRELRRDPTLQGQIVLRMTIEPDGSVSFCDVQRSDLEAPTLISQVVDRVRAFDFGAEEGIPAITILYPIDFLPAA